MGAYKCETDTDVSVRQEVFVPSERLDEFAIHPVFAHAESLPNRPAKKVNESTAKSEYRQSGSLPVDLITGISAARPVTDSIRVRTSSDRQSRSPNDSGPSSASSESALEEGDDETIQTGTALVAILPSWMVSMIFHLSAILILAVITMSSTVPNGYVEVELTDLNEPASDVVMEITVSEESFDNSLESLVDEVQGPVNEFEPKVESEMMEIFDAGDLMASNEVASGLEVVNPSVGKPESETSDEKTSAKFYGMEAYGRQFVFVIDCSGSMAGRYRWSSAVRELKKSIMALEEDQEFMIFLYNTGIWAMMGQDPELAELKFATDENKKQVSKWLEMAQPFADTYPALSMKLALGLKPDAIFMLSDGELHDNTVGLLRVWNSGEETGKIPINTVFLGNGPGRMTMTAIAEQNDGQFEWAK